MLSDTRDIQELPFSPSLLTDAPGNGPGDEDTTDSRTSVAILNATAKTTSLEFNELCMDYANDLDLGQLWDIPSPLAGDSELFSAFLSPALISADDKTIVLSEHYFSTVCPINSCFDSHHNPFRFFVRDLMGSSPLIHLVVMMVSASHICHIRNDMRSVALKHRSEAIALLKEFNISSVNKKFEVVLSSILLGMTSAWQDPTSLGLGHLRSSRTLFKEWSSDFDITTSMRSRSFIVGIMAYWEAMTSFLTTEGPANLKYLSPFYNQEHNDEIVYPNPWTGISTTLFIYAAEAGALCRQNRTMLALCSSTTSSLIRDEICVQQFSEAAGLEKKVLHYSAPILDRIEDCSDEHTPAHHFDCLAQIYRLSILLLLYITFPGLLGRNNEGNSIPPGIALQQSPQGSARQEIVSLAVSLLNVVSSAPESSGIKILLTFPLILAGSALQKIPKAVPKRESASEIGYSRIVDEVLSIHCSDDVLLHWRSFVRQKLQSLHRHIALDPILRAIQILDAVWLRADLSFSTNSDEASLVHWMDVMAEERLESIFG